MCVSQYGHVNQTPPLVHCTSSPLTQSLAKQFLPRHTMSFDSRSEGVNTLLIGGGVPPPDPGIPPYGVAVGGVVQVDPGLNMA